MEQFRKLNERGVREFKSYILALKAGGTSAPPTHLCYDADTSEALPFDCNLMTLILMTVSGWEKPWLTS